MRLLFFSTSYPNPLQPRIGSFNHSLIQALAEDHWVRVVAPIPWTSELAITRRTGRRMPDGRMSYAGGVPAVHPRFYYFPRLMPSQLARTMEWSCAPCLDQQIQAFRPDAVVSYWADPDGRVALDAARRHSLPAITMSGGSDVLVLARGGQRRTAIFSVLKESDAVIAVSQDIANVVISGGVQPEKVTVVRRGVDRAVFTPGNRLEARHRLGIDPTRKMFLFVGRLVPVKGLSTLIEAADQLRRQGVDFACYVCGEGSLRARLESQVRSRGLERSIYFSGSQPQEQLVDWYRAADFTVLPSLSEGIPNVLMESMCCETPFVASNVGGIPEIADPNHDQLGPVGNSESWAEALKQQLLRPCSRTERIFRPMTWTDSAAQLARVAERLTAQPMQSLLPLTQPAKDQTHATTAVTTDGCKVIAETT